MKAKRTESIPQGIEFFRAHIAGLEYKGHTLYLGRCPNCQRREFRVFDTDPIEWRCAKCNLSGWGVAEFVEAIGKNRLPKEMEANQGVEERRQERIKGLAGYRDSLLSNGHPKRIGPAIWVWLYLNNQVEGSHRDREGQRWRMVKSPSLQELISGMAQVLAQSERNIRNHLNRLKRHDYIRISRDIGEVHVIDLEAGLDKDHIS